ncbi:isoprenylcysteine carboxylmethyltransferase family protein [Herbidospora sp. NEAU-GS84]|uniref:Isoprenylcysteine carboxylmethyltransferase family protein n=1 Tax=Herbidospora solisilvae TaxID=2696284 RepID=A0A7C9NFW3_9ACTN|nr:isoprenylcysteine carboxylmethyltransferase family protein [Herbidospora solisilvae]NAS21958.1 isoprenylcysteine carboxylmethyltransferase family protein [Herbidospora solisilvae]
MSLPALVVYGLGLALAFGHRSWAQWRATGSTGFVGIREPVLSLGWWGGMLFVLSIALTVAAPVLELAGITPATVEPMAVGLVFAVAGLILTLAAQNAMGASWRVGVDADERTDLVTSGVFGLVRNPIFTAMVVALAGLPLLVPTWVSLAALLSLVAAVEIQVRVVEEPYLIRVHGAAFTTYMARTGRFVPKF